MDYGIVVDLETTGLDPNSDRIIEIGILEFALEGDQNPVITNLYSALEDPGVPLDPKVAELTGLNDRLLQGQKIDWQLVGDFFDRASMAIAHNAAFDSAFLARVPEVRERSIHWACTLRHIDWGRHGYKSKVLNYLAADQGFVNPFAHRALFDCATTFRLMTPYMQELITRSYENELSVYAYQSPFESKDKLKERGYGWDARERVWVKTVAESQIAAEREFLANEVYQGRCRHQEVAVERLGWT